MKQNDLNIGYNIDYNTKKGLTVTKRLADYLRYSSKPVEIKGKVYISEDFVAYCDITIKRNPTDNSYQVDVNNIRRKEYFDDPLTKTEIEQLNKIAGGINEIKERTKYIKECGGNVEDHSFTPKFI